VHAFTKYLPLYGWQPIVLTVDDNYYLGFMKDGNLFKEYHKNVLIYRTGSLEPKNKIAQTLRANIYGINKTNPFFEKFGKKALRKLYNMFVIPDEQVLWMPFAIREGLRLIRKYNIDVLFATTPPHSVGIIGAVLSYLSCKPFILDVRDDWV